MKAIHKLLILLAFVGLGVGYLYGNGLHINDLIDQVPFIQLIVIIFMTIYTGYIHIFMHEFGHYLFGKVTGYKLVYFQMPNFRYEAKTKRLKKIPTRISGMVGQCLMKPPSNSDNARKPYFLYLAGGLIVNLITALLLYMGSFVMPDPISFNLFVLSLPPFLLFFMNIIPLGFTDGGLILELKKSDLSKRLYFKQLELSSLLEEGKTFSEIPEAYFSEVKDGSFSNSKMGEYLLLVAYQRSLSLLDFEEADRLLKIYNEHWHYLSSPYAQMIASELLFCHAIFGRKAEAEALMDQINNYPVLKNYFTRSKHVQMAYYFFIEAKVEETKTILSARTSKRDEGLNTAEEALEVALENWLATYLNLNVH